MKNQKHFLQICLVVLAFLFTSSAFAQNRGVLITLHQPPPNQLSAKDLWKMTLDNTTGSPLEVYLEGYGEEQKEGRIVDGKSLVFTLPPGRSNYNYENFKTGNVNWKNNKYEEFIVRTGTVPAGTYTTCVSAYSRDGILVGMEKCMTQVISRGFEGEITLLYPTDLEELDFDKLITFSWSPVPSGGPYKIKIVEIIGNESPEAGIRGNKPFFEREGIRTSTFSYPASAPKFVDGKKYAWQVSSKNLLSNIYLFSFSSGIHVDVELDTLKCTNQPGVYSFTFIAYNRSNNFFNANLLTPTVISPPGTVTVTSTISNPMNIGTQQTVTGTVSFGSTVTGNVEFEIKFSRIPTGTEYPVSAFPPLVLNNCCVPINTLPPMVGWWTFDETTGTSFFDRAGFNNVGTRVGTAGFGPVMVQGALNFTNGHVSVNNHVDLNLYHCDSLFTIDAWIRTSSSATQVIVDKRERTPCGQPIGYSFFTQGGRLGFQLANGVSFGNFIAPSPQLNNGQWRHVAVTLRKTPTLSSIELFVDGVSVHTQTSAITGSLNNGANLLIGAHYPTGSTFQRFNGDIDEVEIFKRVLTQPQIFSIFNAGSAGKCKN